MQNKNYLVIETHHSMLELLFLVYLCNKLRINLCGSIILLFSVFMNIVSMLYLEKNCSILFLILFSTKDFLLFIRNLISCLKFLSASLGQSK